MAEEKVKIDFVSNDAPLKKTIDELEQLGKVDKKNADQFKKSNEEALSASKKRQEAIKQETALIADLEKAKKKAFDPDSIRAYNDDIKKAKDNISVLKGETDKLNTSSGNFLGTLKNVGASLGIVFGTQQLISFGKEAVSLAAKGEGIRTAFSKIGGERELEKLRIATRGAVSDIDLMAQALRGANFGISTDLLSKGLEFAGKVARQTGQDVNFLADSFVNGVGRKSLLILDNLGISQVQLRKEIKKTGGDFEEAVGNVINKKLIEMGVVLETSADKVARLSASFANLKESIGAAIIDQSDKFVQGLEFIFGGSEKRQQIKTAQLQKNLTEITEIQKEHFRGLSDLEKQDAIRSLIAKKDKNQLEIKVLKAYTEVLKAEHAKSNKEISQADIDAANKAAEEAKKHRQELLNKEIADNKKRAETLDKLRFEALKISQQREQLQVEAGSDEELQLKIKALEEIRDFRIATEVEFQQDEINIREQTENDILALRLKYEDDFYKEKAKNDEEEFKRQKQAKESNEKQLEQITKARISAEFDIALTSIDALSQLNNQAYDESLAMLQKRLEVGQITQEQFDKQERELKRKAAGRDKLLSIFNIGVKTAEGVINYLSNPVTAPLVPFVIATGAIQAGLVASKPIPFAKGTKAVKGGQKGKDSVHALLMPDEMVIPVDKKRKYEPILNAIFDEQISPNLLNNLAVGQHMRGGQQKGVDEYDLSNGMKRALRDGVYIKNFPKSNGMSKSELSLLIRRGILK